MGKISVSRIFKHYLALKHEIIASYQHKNAETII